MSNKSSQFDLLVFDWDGTLENSIGCIVQTVQLLFEEEGLGPVDASKAKHVIGLSPAAALRYLNPHFSEQEISALIQRYYDRYQDTMASPLLYDGVVECLPCLKQAGYLLAIATGKSRRGLDNALQKMALMSHFVFTRTAEETFSKPHPLMLNEILTMVSIESRRTLVIGDTVHDLQMAANAGCAAVAMGYGAHDVTLLQQHQPLDIFHDFHALTEWLLERK